MCSRRVRIDLATVDGRRFVNSGGFGAYAEMLANRERHEDRFGRRPGQLMAAITTLVEAEPLAVTLNGEAARVWTAFIGNRRREPSGLGPSRRGRLDDGRFEVRLLRADLPRSRTQIALAMCGGRLGALDGLPGAERQRAAGRVAQDEAAARPRR
jgi:undecaprenyl-diphosphatase